MYPHLNTPSANCTLYVGDLEVAVNEVMLHSFFIKFGPIYSVRIMKDLNTK